MQSNWCLKNRVRYRGSDHEVAANRVRERCHVFRDLDVGAFLTRLERALVLEGVRF